MPQFSPTRRSRAGGARIGAAVLVVLLPLLTACSPTARSRSADDSCHGACVEYAFAVTGDIPYTEAQMATFETLIRSVNADSEIQMVAHLGDLKGEQECDTGYYRKIRAEFDYFRPSLVYTPGDNEWSDCSRESAGGYNPLERLSTVRKIFFDHPGRTLGAQSESVESQAQMGYPENVRLAHAGVSVAAFHTVGPLNGLELWRHEKRPTRAQKQEVAARTAADVRFIQGTFAAAARRQDKAVVLLTQADMFPPRTWTPEESAPYRPIVQAISKGAQEFPGEVYLFNGDTHKYDSDRPLEARSEWLRVYQVPPAGNFTRITIVGDQNVNHYLKVRIRPGAGKVVGWSMIPLT